MNTNSASVETPISHLRSEEYSYRVPTPPRIVVPPPSFHAGHIQTQWNLAPRSNHPALHNVNYAAMTPSSLLDWSYEKRREAQPVLPCLYLGPLNAAKDANFLKQEGITLVLAIRQRHTFETKIMNAALRTARDLNIENDTIDLISDRHLVAAFPLITQKITNHLISIAQLHAKGQPGVPPMGKVLVFCESGNERSAAVAAAYLMETHEDVDYIRAMQVCQTQRFCVNFDDTIKRQLQSYWDILMAKRDVYSQQPQLDVHGISSEDYVAAPVPLRSTTKRALSRDDEDDDMEMEDMEDEARFGGRTFAPFVDNNNNVAR